MLINRNNKNKIKFIIIAVFEVLDIVEYQNYIALNACK